MHNFSHNTQPHPIIYVNNNCIKYGVSQDFMNELYSILIYRVNEYKSESESAELSKTAGELLENADDPKFAKSKVIFVLCFSF